MPSWRLSTRLLVVIHVGSARARPPRRFWFVSARPHCGAGRGPLLASGAGEYFAIVWPELPRNSTEVALIVFATIVATLDVRANSWITGGFLALELLVLVTLTALGLMHPSRGMNVFLIAAGRQQFRCAYCGTVALNHTTCAGGALDVGRLPKCRVLCRGDRRSWSKSRSRSSAVVGHCRRDSVGSAGCRNCRSRISSRPHDCISPHKCLCAGTRRPQCEHCDELWHRPRDRERPHRSHQCLGPDPLSRPHATARGQMSSTDGLPQFTTAFGHQCRRRL